MKFLANLTPFPVTPAGKRIFPAAQGSAVDFRTSRMQGLSEFAPSNPAPCFHDFREFFDVLILSQYLGACIQKWKQESQISDFKKIQVQTSSAFSLPS
jgi:hypothetical protein